MNETLLKFQKSGIHAPLGSNWSELVLVCTFHLALIQFGPRISSWSIDPFILVSFTWIERSGTRYFETGYFRIELFQTMNLGTGYFWAGLLWTVSFQNRHYWTGCFRTRLFWTVVFWSPKFGPGISNLKFQVRGTLNRNGISNVTDDQVYYGYSQKQYFQYQIL